MIRFIYVTGLVLVLFFLHREIRLELEMFQLFGTRSDLVGFLTSVPVHLLGFALIVFRLATLVRGGPNPIFGSISWLERTALVVMVIGILFASITLLPYVTRYIPGTYHLVAPYLHYFTGAKEIILLGVCLYELSRIAGFEMHCKKA